MIGTELALIGAALKDPHIATAAKVAGRHFADARYGAAWDVIVAIAAEDKQPDPSLICYRLNLDGERARLFAADLVEAYTNAFVGDHEDYAAAILDAHDREQIRAAATRALAMLDRNEPAEHVRAELDSVADTAREDDLAAQLLTADEFVDQEIPAEHWIIPDVLAAGDRLMLTGGEGSGKSILLRQIAMATAAGVHPFSRQPITPSRVLVVDVENPLRIMRDKFRGIRDALRVGGYRTDDRILIHRQPAGLDLTTPKGRTHLRAICRMSSPDLLVIGPVYKLFVPRDGVSGEAQALQVVSVIDEIRAEHDCAVMLEHHTPMEQAGAKRQIRPVGSGVWMRWPEFGLGIVPQDGCTVEDRRTELVHWRGARDERAWPRRLQGSGGAPGRLPWLDEDNLGQAWSSTGWRTTA